MNFWCVRHPPVERNGRCIGQTPMEISMDLTTACKEVIANAPLTPRRIFSSDLPRCADLATALANNWKVPLTLDARLREIHFGEWEGQSYDRLQAEDTERWEDWCQRWQEARPPEGENLSDLEERVRGWLQATPLGPEDLVVCHAGTIRCFWVLAGLEWAAAMGKDVPYLKWNRISH